MNILDSFFSNKPIIAAIVAWAIAQIIKIVIEAIANKTLNLKMIMSSGGMPSSHSSFVMALTTVVAITEGIQSTFFAICLAFAIVVMYDAAGVRRAAGTQAQILNIIIKNSEIKGIKVNGKLKELIGHSPIEVFAGAILGICVGFIFAF